MSVVLVNDYLYGMLGEKKVLWNYMLDNIPNLVGVDTTIMKNKNEYDNSISFELNVNNFIRKYYPNAKLIIQNGSFFSLIPNNIKKVILIQDNLRKMNANQIIQNNNFMNADYVVSNSDEVDDYYSERHCIQIPLGVDSDLFNIIDMDKKTIRSQLKLPNNFEKIGIFVGSFTETKGWSIMQQVINTRTDIFWLLVTKHDNETCSAANTMVFNKINQELLVKLLNSADFFILPSNSETQCLAAIEANLCNIPVIMRKTGYITNLTKSEINSIGIITDNFLDDSIDKIYERIFDARTLAISKYSINDMINKWITLIDNIITHKYYNYDPLNFLPANSIDIPFTSIFINKIAKKYFPDVTETLIFMEIGALDGNDSLYFYSVYPKSQIYAIEGSTEVFFKYLINKQNVFNVFNTCIYKYNGYINFHIKKTNENGLLSGIHGVYDRGQSYGNDYENVECKTLDTFCVENNIEYIDVVKIDVEGATFDVLNNSTMLKKIKLMHIETEDYPFFKGQKLDREVESLLLSNGFKLICKTGYNPTSEGKQYDSVWINKSYLSDI